MMYWISTSVYGDLHQTPLVAQDLALMNFNQK